MGQYRSGSWARRSGVLGDIAEGKYEEWCKKENRPTERFGADHSALAMASMPKRLRYRPDYLESKRFVEVIGCGRDATFKLAVFKWDCLVWWSTTHPVELYCWDSHKKREAFIPIEKIEQWLNEGLLTIDHFPEKKAYFAIPAKLVFDATA